MEVPRNELKLRDNPELLSAPTVIQPLYGCAKDVNVIGYVPDATLDLELNGVIVVAGFPGHSPFPSGALIKLPAPLVPGEVARFTVDLWATSHVFLPGHRIRLEIASSNFPRFDRNLNTGEDQATGTRRQSARQTVFHDERYPSHVVLPVIPR